MNVESLIEYWQQSRFIQLFSGVLALLIIATLIGQALAIKAGRDSNNPTVTNLNQRIAAWWWMVAALAIGFAIGPTAIILLFMAASALALREFVSLTPTKPADHKALVAAFYILLPIQFGLIWYDWYGLFAIFIPVYGVLTLVILGAMGGETDDFLSRATKLQWATLITVYFISYAPALLLINLAGGIEANMLLLFYLLLIVQLSDVLQYVFGKLFGKRPVAPKLSPSKTIEGLVGGGLSTVAIGTALYWATPFTPWQAALMSFAIVATGFFGGLALSAVKRSMGVKDWGVLIEGHGGMLDRLDSVSFAAPVFFHLCRYFFSQ